jgi:hypothetical protein
MARVKRKEKSIEGVGERIVLGVGFAVGGLGGEILSRFASGRLEVGEQV